MNVLCRVSLVIVGAVVVMGGCSRGGGSRAVTQTPQRPMVQESAVEAAARQDGSALAFYDALESLPMASQDDAINASLLLGTGSTAPTYDQRVSAAKTLGYVTSDYKRPAHQAVTVGEVSSMFVGILEGKLHDPDEALMRMQRRNAVTANVQAFHGLTGAQLASVIGATRDAMGIEGVQRVALPTAPVPAMTVVETPPPAAPPAPPAAATPPAAETSDADKMITSGAALSDPGTPPPTASPTPPPAAAPAPPAPAPAAPATAGRPEPLPDIPASAQSKPVVIGPTGQPTPAAEPAKPPVAKPTPAPTPVVAAAPVKPSEPKAETPKKEEPKPAPSPWVYGKPLKKGS